MSTQSLYILLLQDLFRMFMPESLKDHSLSLQNNEQITFLKLMPNSNRILTMFEKQFSRYNSRGASKERRERRNINYEPTTQQV